MRELQPFALFDPPRSYTWNIISTDYETYTLLLLCWNRGHYSPIHDHTSTGCWIKALQGDVHEIRYARDGERFVETSNVTYTSGVTYMDDQLGCHRVGNPRDDVDAITMHLYTPPYRSCHTWLDASDAPRGVSATPTFYSKFGKLTP
jgi:cysteine dioxygenase